MAQQSEYIIDTRIVSLNSTDSIKLNGALLSNVRFTFSEVLREEADILFTTVCLFSAEIPCSFYNININNNTLEYTVDSIAYSLTISEGNYSASAFITAFQYQFQLGAHGKSIILSINRLTGALSFTISGYTLAFLNTSSIFEVLGLDDETDNIFSTTLQAPYPCNLMGVKKIKLFSNALANNGIDSSSLGACSLIHTLSVDKAAFNLLTYQNNGTHFARLKASSIANIDIQLRDENNMLLDMNNVHWNLSILLNIYRKFSIPQDNVIHLEALEFYDPREDGNPLSKRELKRVREEVDDESLAELNLLLSQ